MREKEKEKTGERRKEEGEKACNDLTENFFSTHVRLKMAPRLVAENNWSERHLVDFVIRLVQQSIVVSTIGTTTPGITAFSLTTFSIMTLSISIKTRHQHK